MLLNTILLIMITSNFHSMSHTPSTLTIEEQASARKAVYEGRLISVSPKRDFFSILEVPKILTDLYKKNPDAVIDLLSRIADGGNPADSIRAASFAIEMVDGPGAGELCASLFKTATYDTVDKDWGHTPREHWVKHIQAKLKK